MLKTLHTLKSGHNANALETIKAYEMPYMQKPLDTMETLETLETLETPKTFETINTFETLKTSRYVLCCLLAMGVRTCSRTVSFSAHAAGALEKSWAKI